MLALARSQRRYSTIARVALTLSGGFAGSMLAIPIGISLSRQSLMSIEDPQHLARVLHDQMERRRRGMAPMPSVSDMPTATSAVSDMDAAPNDAAPPAAARPAAAPPSDNAPTSRWDQLRRNQTSAPSTWEQIRQKNARAALSNSTEKPSSEAQSFDGPVWNEPSPQRSAWSDVSTTRNAWSEAPSSQRSLWNDAPITQSSWDDTRPSPARLREEPRSSDYERAMREYEAAFERERKGIDITSGFSANDSRW